MIASTIHQLRDGAQALVVIVLTAVASLGLSAPTQAQSQILLSEQHVTGFVGSYPEILALAEEYQGQQPAGDDMAASFGALMTAQGALARLDQTVAAHGFANYAEWIQVVSAISVAYVFATEGGSMDAEMQATIDAIQSNPNLTTEQKQTMLQQFEAALTAMDASRPPQQNVDLVNERAAELELIFDQM